MNSSLIYTIIGIILVIVGFFVALGTVIAQVPICLPSGECTPVDYVAAAGGIGIGILIASVGGWFIRKARAM